MKSKGYSMTYRSETEKIKGKIVKYIQKVGPGNCLDIGCGTDKLTANGKGVDSRPMEGVDYVCKDQSEIYNLSDILPNAFNDSGLYGIVYSSHVLEHLPDYFKALNDWVNLIKENGYLILYLPCDNRYDNESNPEHVHNFTLETFINDEFKKVFLKENNLALIESGNDYGYDKYSFFIVCQKLP